MRFGWIGTENIIYIQNIKFRKPGMSANQAIPVSGAFLSGMYEQ